MRAYASVELWIHAFLISTLYTMPQLLCLWGKSPSSAAAGQWPHPTAQSLYSWPCWLICSWRAADTDMWAGWEGDSWARWSKEDGLTVLLQSLHRIFWGLTHQHQILGSAFVQCLLIEYSYLSTCRGLFIFIFYFFFQWLNSPLGA
jgi:hypothetical protein